MDAEKSVTVKQTPRKKRLGDRKEGRRIRSLPAFTQMTPFIMKERSDALVYFAETLDITATDEMLREMRKKGYSNIGMLHVFLASYVRTVSQRPGINRFISGQRIFSRNDIEIVMTIKKEMSTTAPDTVIKCKFEPTDTLLDVYDKFNKIVQENNNLESDSSFDKTANALINLPRPILRGAIRFLNWLDYHGWLPQSLLDISPFHGSFIVTSMGSLGIKPVFHHIYNFGNLPIFLSYGTKRKEKYTDPDDGSEKTKSVIDIKIVADERICDGFYYATAFKTLMRYCKNPEVLMTPPEQVFEDVD